MGTHIKVGNHIFFLTLASALLIGCGGSSVNRNQFVAEQQRSIGPDSDPRGQIRNECWYALDPKHLTITNDTVGPDGNSRGGELYGNGYVISKAGWNYMSQNVDGNANALRSVLKTYGGQVSDAIDTSSVSLSPSDIDRFAKALSNDNFGLRGQVSGPGLTSLKNTINNHSHGAECLSFAMMIIYRARHGKEAKFSYPRSVDGYKSAKQAAVGDIVFHIPEPHQKWSPHTAICVGNDGSHITVVDSNYCWPPKSTTSSEVISKHVFTYADIDAQDYRMWSASNYIN